MSGSTGRAPGLRSVPVVMVLALVVGVAGLSAQTTATIQGTITGPTGTPLQGVQVSVTGAQGARSAVSDDKGFYLISDLAPGSYRLAAALGGYAAAEGKEVELGSGQTLTLDISLQSLTFSEEVVVTSQKRTAALLEIPMSITAISGETIEQQRVEDFLDFVPMVPGLSVVTGTPGQTRITLRGINTGGVASTVGVYVDEVPFGSSTGLANGAILAGEFDTFDVARIEVLRGP
ncbi:MAG: Plug and carboxypeptidase regulatory-like domain-containing protein, partial [Thermoanaerobaculales bacterium]|nr:Plug and carboxypeptidase regulatory-like domain-containing protein [Thermoanaerobaculales bacterium]